MADFARLASPPPLGKTKKKKKTKGSRGRQHMSTFRSFQLFDSIPPKTKVFYNTVKKAHGHLLRVGKHLIQYLGEMSHLFSGDEMN